ncbi:hypothetical protein DH2020_007720 [Rehmannia glutinosa]|uniref:Methylglutaconyl-CoA hydratase n=1 Tax=Rehmannia glutinosa TaxID=99300 RepID=A0ABR0TZT1_REHGL
MVAFGSLAKSLKYIKLHNSAPRLFRFQSIRTLLLQSASESVKLRKLIDSDSGLEQKCYWKRYAAGLQYSFETVNKDHSAKVLMICSSVPKVFCAGADLKVSPTEHWSFFAWLKLAPISYSKLETNVSYRLHFLIKMLSDAVKELYDIKYVERKTMSPSEVQNFVHSLRSTFSYLEVYTYPSCPCVANSADNIMDQSFALYIPTIAVIEGAALGGGLEMALSCDLRICGEDALLGLPETGLAIIPGRASSRAGGTQRLPRLIGKSMAKELIFTGRKIGGRDALSMGLVNYCVPAGEARSKALEIARDINQKGPLAIRMAKRAIDGGLEVDMETALALEEDCYEQLLHTKDRMEGLAAFAERRMPNYTGE